jgi:hypothetical protein
LAQRQVAQPNDVFEDIGDWISRRNAQAGASARNAEAVGRRLWNEATRTGQNILGRTQSELRALGAGQSGQPILSARPPSTPSGPTVVTWLDGSPAAKFLGGQMAEGVGQGAGALRGAWHSLEGLGFMGRLANYDPDAWGSVIDSGSAAADYIRKGIANPAKVGQDIQNAAHQFQVGVDPGATPMADTFAGEMRRRLGIGLNQGELAWDVGTLAAGSPALKAVEGLGAVGDATSAAEFAKMGFKPAQAERLTQPYSGIGHHSPLSQAVANDLGIPPWLRDSSFNVVKPDGMNQGDFYRFHFQTDPQYYGSGFSRKIGGPGWSGKKLGLQKYGLLGRLWYGTPAPLAGAFADVGAAGISNYNPAQDPTQ